MDMLWVLVFLNQEDNNNYHNMHHHIMMTMNPSDIHIDLFTWYIATDHDPMIGWIMRVNNIPAGHLVHSADDIAIE
jgi:hypothetical protein